MDDGASIRQVTRQTQVESGYQALLASNASEAVSMYRAHQDGISVMLTDMIIPVMDGNSTILESLRVNPSVCVIGTSGIKSEIGPAATPDAGLRDFLPKPYTAGILLKAMRLKFQSDTEAGHGV